MIAKFWRWTCMAIVAILLVDFLTRVVVVVATNASIRSALPNTLRTVALTVACFCGIGYWIKMSHPPPQDRS